MEAMAGMSPAGCVELGVRAETALPSRAVTSYAGKSAFPDRRRVTGVGCSTSSAPFEDNSHMRFYSHGGCGGRRTRVIRAAMSPSVADVARRSEEKTIRKEKKMKKKLAKAEDSEDSTSASSESSSSSESEMETEAEVVEGRGRRRARFTSDQFKEEWERILRSPVMDGIPSISSNFTFQRPPPQPIPVREEGVSDGNRAVAESAAAMDQVANNLAVLRLSSGTCAGSSLATIPQVSANEAEPGAAAKVEVCMGKSCKKAGSENVLSKFVADGVDASPCKCMKNCKLAVNVRVQQENDAAAKMYSGVGMQDVKALSEKYLRARSRELPPLFAH